MDNPRQLALELAATLKARSIYQGPKRPRSQITQAGNEEAEPSPQGPKESWEALRSEALACELCSLCETRTQVVFGEGSASSELMFVGEAPGRDEDAQGRPFVGRAGQLLTRMIEAMGFAREEVYIANVLKCRPPNNRDPAPDEVEKCRPYLLRQLEHIGPKVVCALGRHALRALTGYAGSITKVRGRPMTFLDMTVFPTYHPAYLLRNPAAKADAWEDLKTILKYLGRPVPQGKKSRG
ncbi:MAG: uracil-DNA glycosylase [Planctomycetota bacterium]